jgi:hypothetical protein
MIIVRWDGNVPETCRQTDQTEILALMFESEPQGLGQERSCSACLCADQNRCCTLQAANSIDGVSRHSKTFIKNPSFWALFVLHRIAAEIALKHCNHIALYTYLRRYEGSRRTYEKG